MTHAVGIERAVQAWEDTFLPAHPTPVSVTSRNAMEAAIVAYLSAIKPSGDAGEVLRTFTMYVVDGEVAAVQAKPSAEYADEGKWVLRSEAADLITTLERQLATAREALEEASAEVVAEQYRHGETGIALESAAKGFLDKVAEVSIAVGWQANVGASETAGQIISCLYANPEHFDRFMAEGSELFIDGTFAFENGALTYHAADGRVLSPSVLRERKGTQQ